MKSFQFLFICIVLWFIAGCCIAMWGNQKIILRNQNIVYNSLACPQYLNQAAVYNEELENRCANYYK